MSDSATSESASVGKIESGVRRAPLWVMRRPEGRLGGSGVHVATRGTRASAYNGRHRGTMYRCWQLNEPEYGFRRCSVSATRARSQGGGGLRCEEDCGEVVVV